MTFRSRRLRASPRAVAQAGIAAAALVAAVPAEARITRIEIKVVQSPTFEGQAFGAVGAYEKLAGRAYGEIDPNDPRNAVIVDIKLAPRNARGMVEYVTDIYILRPVDRSKGNRKVFFELNNRGSNLAFGQMNDAPADKNDPATAADAGNGFLMRQGYTLVWSGWDSTAAPGGGRFTVQVPVAQNPDGSPIVGLSMEEFVIDAETKVGPLTYPAAHRETSKATLTMRARIGDEPTPIPPAGWAFNADGTAINLLPEGTPFKVGMLYELVYEAKNPRVSGIGFAAVRDVAAFLRAPADDAGNANPVAGDAQRVYSYCISQPCRMVRDFVALGFNETDGPARGTMAFDGVLNWVGGGSGIFMNYRFAQPFRTHRQHIGRNYPEFEFPFAWQVTTDPATGKTDGRLRRCTETGTCPKMFEVNSDNEYWAKSMAPMHVDGKGADLPDAPGVRSYLVAGAPHGGGVPSTGPGICQQPRNPMVGNPAMRALLVALDEWVVAGREPPPSRLPRRDDGTLVRTLPQAEYGFPLIPGVLYNGRMHGGDLFDFGPRAAEGVLTRLPPILVGTPYPALVPKADGDGNTLPGIRLPEVAVPLATYTGWNLRKVPLEEGCDHAGMRIPFAATKAERLAAGDPRPSIEERYATKAAYIAAVTVVVEKLRAERLLLAEDAERYLKAAAETAAVK